MDNPIPEFDKIRRQLMTIEKPKKLKLLVVDDEPDNLDLLYRTFRRDFNVLKADSGVNALQVLATEWRSCGNYLRPADARNEGN